MSTAQPKSLFGCFSDHSYISTDPEKDKTDVYIKHEPIPSRYLGANFHIRTGKAGRGPDSLLSKEFLTLASTAQNKGKPDEYVDPGAIDRKRRIEAKKLNIVEGRDFKYASGLKSSTGPGSWYGTLQGKPFEHMPDYKVTQRDEVPERPKPQPPNIKTNWPKKGTFGMIGHTFSKIEGTDKHDDYDALRKKEREEWEASKKKNITTAVFKTIATSKTTFDAKPNTGISSVYDYVEPTEDTGKKKRRKSSTKAASKTKEPETLKPWKVSSPAKSGQYGCLNRFPNSHENPDPYESSKLKAKEQKQKGPKPLGGAWKPVSGQKSSVIRSLLRRFY